MTRLASWWLQRQGYFVAPPDFNGVVLGNCVATIEGKTRMVVEMQYNLNVIRLNHSYVAHLEAPGEVVEAGWNSSWLK